MNFRPATAEQAQDVDLAVALLTEARKLLKRAGAIKTLDRVRKALKSAEGAQRHIRHRQMRTGANGEDNAFWKQVR